MQTEEIRKLLREVLSQAVEGIAVHPACAHHIQAQELQRGEVRSAAWCRARQDKGQNSRAENWHQPTRLRERLMRRFKSAGHAQRFLSAFGILTSHFRLGAASVYRRCL
jgi:transposase-like protein